jgi:NAD(P)-dependent dehydrogenase (short-subunit alcohol dehydrogenase family)
MKISGNTFLVTGGSSGLGAACVERLASQGANVVSADINAELGAQAAKSLGKAALGKAVCFQKTDVTDPQSVQAAIDAATKQFGGLHGVINCAGILHAARVVGREGPYDLNAFKRVIEVNLVGTFNVIRLAAVFMSQADPNEEGERGVIVNTASVAADDGQIGQASYSASKAGVTGMMLPIAREFARFGIRVVAIAPGAFKTPMVDAMPDEARMSLESQVPFPPRFGRPSEYAALAQQIIENPYFNGSTVRLDGALRMGAK